VAVERAPEVETSQPLSPGFRSSGRVWCRRIWAMARADGVYLGANVCPRQEPGAAGVSCQTRGDSASLSLARMARCGPLSSVRCRKVPAGPVRCPA
jgi:hypothetical protein